MECFPFCVFVSSVFMENSFVLEKKHYFMFSIISCCMKFCMLKIVYKYWCQRKKAVIRSLESEIVFVKLSLGILFLRNKFRSLK